MLLISAVLTARFVLIPDSAWQAGQQGVSDPSGQDSADDGDSFTGPAFRPDASDGQLDNAAWEAVQTLTERFPDSPDGWHALARVQFGLGRRGEAIAAWERCLELDAKHTEAHHGLARAAFDKADYPVAEQWSRKWLALAPQDPGAQSMLAEVLAKLDQPEGLISVFEPIFLRAELSPEAGVQLGLAQVQLQRYAPAERTFQAVLAATSEPRLQKRSHYGDRKSVV